MPGTADALSPTLQITAFCVSRPFFTAASQVSTALRQVSASWACPACCSVASAQPLQSFFWVSVHACNMSSVCLVQLIMGILLENERTRA